MRKRARLFDRKKPAPPTPEPVLSKEKVDAMVAASGLEARCWARRCFRCSATVPSREAAAAAGWTIFRPGADVCPSCWPDMQKELWRARRATASSLRKIARWIEDLGRSDVDGCAAKWLHYSQELVGRLTEEIEDAG